MEQRKENDVVMDDVVEGGRKAGLASLRRRGREGASSGARRCVVGRWVFGEKRTGRGEDLQRARPEDGGLPEQKRSLEREV